MCVCVGKGIIKRRGLAESSDLRVSICLHCADNLGVGKKWIKSVSKRKCLKDK